MQSPVTKSNLAYLSSSDLYYTCLMFSEDSMSPSVQISCMFVFFLLVDYDKYVTVAVFLIPVLKFDGWAASHHSYSPVSRLTT